MIKSLSCSVISEPEDLNKNFTGICKELNNPKLFDQLEHHGAISSYIDLNFKHVKFMTFNSVVHYYDQEYKHERKSIQQQLIYKTNKKVNTGTYGSIYYGKYKIIFHKGFNSINPPYIKNIHMTHNQLLDKTSHSELKKCENNIYQNYKIIDVAIKIIEHSDARDNENNEIDILYELSDLPDIIHLFNYSIDPITKNCILIMELCEGGDLFDYFSKNYKKFTEKYIKSIIIWIINIIKECHKRGIFHSDIKLENIGLKYENNCNILRLLDFGGAKFIHDNNGQYVEYNGIVSSPSYTSPEILSKIYEYKIKQIPENYQIIGENLFRIDVWTIGIVLYVLCTGHYPYKGKNPDKQKNIEETLSKISKGNPPNMTLLKDNSQLCELILRFLDYNPDTRITLDEALEHPFLKQ